MKKLLIPFLIGCFLVMGLSIVPTFAVAETVVILGEPSDDPVDDEPPQDEPPPETPPDPELPPETPPEPEPEPISATVNITPKTLNLKSRGRFITASINLPDGFNVNQIDGNTVQISAIDGQPIEPISADKTMASEIESDNCLIAKFERGDLINVLTPGDGVKITIEGLLTSGEKFTGDDTIRVIGPGKWFYVNARKKRFIFRLGRHLSSDSRIVKALLWMNCRKKDWKIRLWLRKFLNGKWSRLLNHRFGKHYFLPTIEGDGYEWDFTETVKENWEKGIYYVTIFIDYDTQSANGYPALIVTYEGSSTLEETAIEEQDLTPIAPRFILPKEKNLVKLFFRNEDILGMDTGNIVICGWNETTSQWEVMPDSTLNLVEQSVTTKRTGYRLYQIMCVSSSSPGQNNPGEGGDPGGSSKNSLGQNYPNPFNPSTTINYSISKDCHVTLKLYNICGQLVATIVDEFQQAGSYSKHFDGGDKLSRGIYYYQLKAGNFVDTKRMAVLR
ncbi:T9SS type A sorting domain-containing protein [bacterium]|nr:T9SS type A sorting domain-containing protein [bacterium]NIO18831.1 T9SS type A sorting domain-containing protein [bacterium]